MIHTCEALSLRTYPFGEGNKIAVFLTSDYGLVRGVAYGANKPKSRFGGSLESLTHVRMTFRRKAGQDLAVIENCEIIRPLLQGQPGWESSLYAGYFAELLNEFAREQVECDKLMRLSLAVIAALEDVDASLLARYFEFWVLKLEGILPALDRLIPLPLAKKTFEWLKLPPIELGSIEWSADELERLERAAGKLIEYHLEKPLKAKKMLKEWL